MSGRRSSVATTDAVALLRDIVARLERIEEAMAVRPRTGSRLGRPPTNDSAELDEIRTLVAQGVVRETAIKSVAESLGGNVDAHIQRLGRKLNTFKTF